MRRVAAVTVARSDLGIYLPLFAQIHAHPELDLQIIASGMHLAPNFGSTAEAVEQHGFHISAKVDCLVGSDSPAGVAKSVGLGVTSFAQLFASWQPDILVVLGDRFDMLPAALAALPFRIPVAHLLGGEVTEGAIDESIRHSLTKLSHLHFVAAEEYRQRVLRMGEEPWRVHVTGTPALDAMKMVSALTREQLEAEYGLPACERYLLVTHHPETLCEVGAQEQISEVLAALEGIGLRCVFTCPNADSGNAAIRQSLERTCETHQDWTFIANASQQGYFGLMASAAAMVGNSSSGILEAPSFCLPVVNAGDRQRGRIRSANVIDCPVERNAIRRAINHAVSSEFAASLATLENPFGDGHAAERITAVLAAVDLNARLVTKRFYDFCGE